MTYPITLTRTGRGHCYVTVAGVPFQMMRRKGTRPRWDFYLVGHRRGKLAELACEAARRKIETMARELTS